MKFLSPATKLGQGYFFTGVCDSVHMGGSASVHAGTPPAGADNSPPAQSMLGDTVNAQAVRIRLECNLVKNILSPFFKTEAIFKYKSKIVHQHILIQGV